MNPDSTAINGSRLKRFHYRALWENGAAEEHERMEAENANLPVARRRRRGRPPRAPGE